MLQYCLEGIVLGLCLAISLGPSFFSLIQTSLGKGVYAAIRLAVGIFISDTFLVAIAILGASRLFEIHATKYIVGLVGGAVLVGYGIYTYLSKADVETVIEQSEEIKVPSQWTDLVRGFFTNMANPATWLFWFIWVGTIMGRNTINGVINHVSVAIFFVSALLTVLITDLTKSFVANKIKPYLNNRTMTKINKIIGVLLFLFGVYIMLMVVLELFGLSSIMATEQLV